MSAHLARRIARPHVLYKRVVEPTQPRARGQQQIAHRGARADLTFSHHHGRRSTMDKDRVKGSLKQAKGAVKEAIGKATGDAKLESEGKADKASGKVQNAVGGLKDALRGK